ncbi:Protein CBG27719 [Caenorhabditis briggsae]|uniref:Protein CBG27719 n=1 Tax=Caenorhabditis briggsae TaxID=6238 RepID=B6IJ17_CAEBR|nr:Protein CBG27719 [Caenorhabditis briggsae]CAR99997.1 Protein CBG27719 [Caenorhabditis briggsae]
MPSILRFNQFYLTKINEENGKLNQCNHSFSHAFMKIEIQKNPKDC